MLNNKNKKNQYLNGNTTPYTRIYSEVFFWIQSLSAYFCIFLTPSKVTWSPCSTYIYVCILLYTLCSMHTTPSTRNHTHYNGPNTVPLLDRLAAFPITPAPGTTDLLLFLLLVFELS